MVLPYLKGFYNKVVVFYIVLVIFVVFLYASIWFLTSGIRALSLADIVGKYFLFLQIFFFRRRKKRVVTFQKFSVYLCAKFAETGCISEFLSEKHPS
jgi:choline-glycine betaine transporter